MSDNARAIRVFMFGFGALFASVTVGGVASSFHTSQSLFLVVPVSVAMVVASVWILGSAIVFVRVRPGESVGGGPLLASMRMLPGEQVLGWEFGEYGPELGNFMSFTLLGHQWGCVFITDRRLIFVPYRFLRWPTASASVPFSEMTDRATMWAKNLLTVTTTGGVEHRFRVYSARTIEVIKAAASRELAETEVPSVAPRTSRAANMSVMSVGIALSLAFILFGIASMLGLVTLSGIGLPPVAFVAWGVIVLVLYLQFAKKNARR